MPEASEKGLVDKPMTAVRASERTVAQLRIGGVGPSSLLPRRTFVVIVSLAIFQHDAEQRLTDSAGPLQDNQPVPANEHITRPATLPLRLAT